MEPLKRTQHRSEQEIFTAMEEFEKDGNISPKEFCEIYQISDATFYNWQKRYRAKDTIKEELPAFMPIRVVEDSEDGDVYEETGTVFAEVRAGVIRIYQKVDASYLKELR